ncbi:hypothetical protein FQR65_LT00115 [Abscondita terminalis]|nr:hypothetical protein FQR65_LT00115 [Abscondita terminalis]
MAPTATSTKAVPAKASAGKTTAGKATTAPAGGKVAPTKAKPATAKPTIAKPQANKKQFIRGKSTKKSKKKEARRFTIDCTHPVEDNLLDVANFEKYLLERIKVNGKTNNLGNNISLGREKNTKIVLSADIPFSKRRTVPLVSEISLATMEDSVLAGEPSTPTNMDVHPLDEGIFVRKPRISRTPPYSPHVSVSLPSLTQEIDLTILEPDLEPKTPNITQEERSNKKRRLETPPDLNVTPPNMNELAQKTVDALKYIEEVMKISNSILKTCEESQNTKKEIKHAVRSLHNKTNKLHTVKSLIDTLNKELHLHKTKLSTLDPEYRKQLEISKFTQKIQQALDKGKELTDNEFVTLIDKKWPDTMFNRTKLVNKIDHGKPDQDFLVLHNPDDPENSICKKILNTIPGMKTHIKQLEPGATSPLMGTIKTDIVAYTTTT